MNDCFEWRIRLNCLVKSSSFGNVFHDHKVELVFGDLGVVVQDLLAFFGGPNGSNHRVPTLEKNV